MKLEFSQQYFENAQISNFRKIHPVGAELFHVDRWTDKHYVVICECSEQDTAQNKQLIKITVKFTLNVHSIKINAIHGEVSLTTWIFSLGNHCEMLLDTHIFGNTNTDSWTPFLFNSGSTTCKLLFVRLINI